METFEGLDFRVMMLLMRGGYKRKFGDFRRGTHTMEREAFWGKAWGEKRGPFREREGKSRSGEFSSAIVLKRNLVTEKERQSRTCGF